MTGDMPLTPQRSIKNWDGFRKRNLLMGLRRLSAGTWRIRNGGWKDEIVRNLGRQRHFDGRRQTIRLQNDSADCSTYSNYGR